MAALTQKQLEKRWKRHVHLKVCEMIIYITDNTFPNDSNQWIFCSECSKTRCLKYPTKLLCDRHTTTQELTGELYPLYKAFKRLMDIFPFDGLDFESLWTKEKWVNEFGFPEGKFYKEFLLTSKYIFSDVEYYQAIYRKLK